MLHRTMQRALRSDARGAPPRMSLLLDNRCPHHAYRDEMRDMLIGRDHSVWKVHASSIVCVETLVTPPPAPLNLERSLERYAEHLARRAQARRPPARARPASATLPRRADPGRPIGAVGTSRPRARPASARRVPALLPHACRARAPGRSTRKRSARCARRRARPRGAAPPPRPRGWRRRRRRRAALTTWRAARRRARRPRARATRRRCRCRRRCASPSSRGRRRSGAPAVGRAQPGSLRACGLFRRQRAPRPPQPRLRGSAAPRRASAARLTPPQRLIRPPPSSPFRHLPPPSTTFHRPPHPSR